MKDDIRKLLGSEKLIMGAERTIKALRAGTLAKVYLANNVEEETLDDIEQFSNIAGVEIIETGMPNDELGVLCKKPFSISVLGVLK